MIVCLQAQLGAYLCFVSLLIPHFSNLYYSVPLFNNYTTFISVYNIFNKFYIMSGKTELIKSDTLLHIYKASGITLREFFTNSMFDTAEQN